jgi:hypothetical protein
VGTEQKQKNNQPLGGVLSLALKTERKITGEEVRGRIKSIWPQAYPLCTDGEFLLPGREEVRELVVRLSVAALGERCLLFFNLKGGSHD